ncbi:OB-fold nucleic acid binding domain-containing protein isoform 3 [Quillaja saponaria]|uniref:OB-fold nucleic acid binding domain-containing protein isoform 3 n=1 Tax=Quillaja saponaria TaxID=32244 RepID=A0AAD7LK99_QUISA|nr:OB-fold nucleic acid binding domain-containing protein isoform 3 [Quillaja saponaria]
MAANGNIDLSIKQLIVSALCKHLSLDPKVLSVQLEENDIKGLYLSILKSTGDGASLNNNEEVMKWIAFAQSFPVNPEDRFGALKGLNDGLAQKSVLLGNGIRPSEADVIVFSVLHSAVISLSESDKDKLPHVLRWMDYIQSKEDFENLFKKLLLVKAGFSPQPRLQAAKPAGSMEVDVKEKKTEQSTKNVDKSEADPKTQKSEIKEKGREDKDATQAKKKPAEPKVPEKDMEVSVSLLNIQVGLICKAWKHPSADSLLVEEIDVGDAKLRQVVSGLAKYTSPDALTNRRVVLITNVKPGKLRDVMSEGLVLCASNEDHTIVEPLLPPEGVSIGERVSFSGIDGKPEDVLNPKKKQLEKITPNLYTDEKGVATFKGIPFMTSGGPCTSSIPKATIK